MGRKRIDTSTAEVLVFDVPVAGAMAGLNRAQSYTAAKRGDMPTLVIGGRIKVPAKAWRAKLNGEAA
jgi:hypothetical protein